MNPSISQQDLSGLQPKGMPALLSPEPEFVDLNEIVQQLSDGFKNAAGSSKAIIRFDELPVVPGSRENIERLFRTVFHSIIELGPAATKPFIYIKTERHSDDSMDLRLCGNNCFYTLMVFTNIAADAGWLEHRDREIEEMKTSLQLLQGQMQCSTIQHTGCLYSITLPGKSK